MKKIELIERVQKKIDELGTLFARKVYTPKGDLIGKIMLLNSRAHSVTLAFGGYYKTIGLTCKNPEKVVENFYNEYKETQPK